MDIGYDVPRVSKVFDFINVMCYDYHGKWDKKTGHNAPLHSRATEPAADQVRGPLARPSHFIWTRFHFNGSG